MVRERDIKGVRQGACCLLQRDGQGCIFWSRGGALFLPAPVADAEWRVVEGLQLPELVVAAELEEALGDGLESDNVERLEDYRRRQ